MRNNFCIFTRFPIVNTDFYDYIDIIFTYCYGVDCITLQIAFQCLCQNFVLSVYYSLDTYFYASIFLLFNLFGNINVPKEIEEQENAGIEVSIEAVIDGQHKVLTKTLEGNLKRNTIYTVTVRKNDINIVVKVGIDDWEPGEDTEIIPQL